MSIVLNGSTGITDADGGAVLNTNDFASQAQAEAGTDNTTVMTPLRVAQAVTADIATQAEAQAGTNNEKLMTPLRVAQATQASRLSSSTLTNVTASRAVSTNYQNTTSSWRVVYVTVTNNGSALLTGSTSGGQSTVCSLNATNSTLVGLIPPGWYYSVTGSVLTSWWES